MERWVGAARGVIEGVEGPSVETGTFLYHEATRETLIVRLHVTVVYINTRVMTTRRRCGQRGRGRNGNVRVGGGCVKEIHSWRGGGLAFYAEPAAKNISRQQTAL